MSLLSVPTSLWEVELDRCLSSVFQYPYGFLNSSLGPEGWQHLTCTASFDYHHHPGCSLSKTPLCKSEGDPSCGNEDVGKPRDHLAGGVGLDWRSGWLLVGTGARHNLHHCISNFPPAAPQPRHHRAENHPDAWVRVQLPEWWWWFGEKSAWSSSKVTSSLNHPWQHLAFLGSHGAPPLGEAASPRTLPPTWKSCRGPWGEPGSRPRLLVVQEQSMWGDALTVPTPDWDTSSAFLVGNPPWALQGQSSLTPSAAGTRKIVKNRPESLPGLPRHEFCVLWP